MYEQIAANKRRTVIYVGLFFLIWLGIGAVLGALFGSHATGPNGEPVTTQAPIVAGMVITGLLAVAGILFSLSSGDKLVLAVSGAKPADPIQYKQLHDIVEALAIGDGMPK